jgi:hypothetical protein
MSATLTAAEPGRAGLPEPDLLPRGRQGRHFAANLPQEARQAFTEAVVEVDGY